MKNGLQSLTPLTSLTTLRGGVVRDARDDGDVGL